MANPREGETTADRILRVLLAAEPRNHGSTRTLLRELEETMSHEEAHQLRQLMADEDARAGRTLQELAKDLALRPPTVLARLRLMEEEGLVRRVPGDQPRSPRYRVVASFQGRWIDPETGLFLTWTSPSGIDWRHPLVSRVPDGPAQKILLRWFNEVEEALEGKGLDRPATSFWVFGSCARGDAREGSDLDLLVFSFLPSAAVTKVVKDVTADANLWAERPVQLKVMDWDDLFSAPLPFREALVRDAVTAGFWGDPQFIESPDLQELLLREAKAP